MVQFNLGYEKILIESVTIRREYDLAFRRVQPRISNWALHRYCDRSGRIAVWQCIWERAYDNWSDRQWPLVLVASGWLSILVHQQSLY